MKSFLLLPLIGALVISCTNEQKESIPTASYSNAVVPVLSEKPLTGKMNVSLLKKFSKVNLNSKLKLSLLTTSGIRVEKMSDLQPNTNYSVIVEGSNDLQVRACFGFDLLKQDNQVEGEIKKTIFSIKTHSDVLESPMISVIPLRRTTNVTFREQAQMISLIKTDE